MDGPLIGPGPLQHSTLPLAATEMFIWRSPSVLDAKQSAFRRIWSGRHGMQSCGDKSPGTQRQESMGTVSEPMRPAKPQGASDGL